MKKYIYAIACMAFMGLTSCSNKPVETHVAEADSTYMVGAYADFRALSDEDKQLFETVYAHQGKLTPQSVATQVVAGTNYKFICTDEGGEVVKVVVFKPLPNQGEPKVSSIEPVAEYESIITAIRNEDYTGVSPIYQYKSPTRGFAKADINDDGILELLLGDSQDAYYDIFTYDAAEGKVKHVFCGGERDRVQFTGSWAIVREGSNSASDSFTKFYRLQNSELVEVPTEEQTDSPDILFEVF